MSETAIAVRNSIWRAIKHYAWGLFAKSWNGAIAAVYAVVGQAVGAGMTPDRMNPPGWETAAYTFGVVFVIQALGYFKDNPLPDKLPPDTPPPFASQREVDEGLSKTTMISPATLAALPAVKAADEQLPKAP